MKAPLIALFLTLNGIYYSQQWSLKLSSNVELRNWTLTNKVDKKEKVLQGASISLMKGPSVIASTMSDPNGDFVIDIPAGGDFILTVAYPGTTTKKFYVSTNGVPENVGKDNYKPTVVIGGFVLSKPLTGVDYIGLNEPLVKVEYKSGGQNFDKDDDITSKGLNIVSKISTAENTIVDKFCSFNKMGDDALNKKKCQIAIDYYTKAMQTLPDEEYPKEKMKLAEKCLDAKKMEQEVAAAEKAEKAEALRLANEKAAKEKQAKSDAAAFKAPPTKTTTTVAAKTQTVAADNSAIKAKPSSVPPEERSASKGKSKYKMPHVMASDKYRENITKADGHFRNKRYKEAKDAYEEALKCRDKDNYATVKIAECEKLMAPATGKLN